MPAPPEAVRDVPVRAIAKSASGGLRCLRSRALIAVLLIMLLPARASAASPPASPSHAAPLIGAEVDLLGLSPEARVAELDRLAQAGVHGVCLALDWNRVEPTRGRFTWKADDQAVNAALAHGLEVLLLLGPCAEWAVDPAQQVPLDQRRFSVPKNVKDWGRYVREAALHFRGRVRYWQVRQQPNLRNFRGTRGEFLKLLAVARAAIREVDPRSIIVTPESGSIDIAEIARLVNSDDRSSFDVIGLYLDPKPGGLSAFALAWSVLNTEVLEGGPPGAESSPQATATSPPVWVLGSGGSLSADDWLQRYLLAWAFGADRFYLPADAISPEWTTPVKGAELTGHLRLGPEIWAFAFQREQAPFALAWDLQETTVPTSAIAPIADPEAVRSAARLGGAPGSAAVVDGDAVSLILGPRPILIPGLSVDSAPASGGLPITRQDVLAARPGPEVSALPLVYADWTMPERPEFGIDHSSLRHLPGGQVINDERAGRVCVRTRMRAGQGEEEQDYPWIYFDVDDRWLYFARGKTPVSVTVECDGSFLGKQKLGFNIMYDSVSGYRFTPWQWVEAGAGWRRYRFLLEDVNFANRNGYDFRINAKGSKQDLWVASVMVEKVPPSLVAQAPLARGQ